MTSDSARDAANDMISDAKSIGRAKADDATEAVSSAASQASATASHVGELVRDAVNGAYGATKNFGLDVADGLPNTKDAVARSHARVRRSVIKQPVEALLLASAIGYLAGWVMNRS